VHSRPLPAPLPGGEAIAPALAESGRQSGDQFVADHGAGESTEIELDLDFDLSLDAPESVVAPPLGEAPRGIAAEDSPLGADATALGDATALPGSLASDAVDHSEAVEPEHATMPKESPPVAPPPPVTPQAPVRDRTVEARVATLLGGGFSEALVYAKVLHDGVTRRGTAVPYLSHLLATAALVLEDGGTETEAIAALLHDAVEDGAPGTAEMIRSRFGPEVADIVVGCSDPEVMGGFRQAKAAHLLVLESGSTSMRRVALAEKLDNARALLRDLERFGAATWSRMDVDRDDMLWYLQSLVALFDRSFPSVLAGELRRVLEMIEQQVGVG
jgi:hypothetical protein